MVLTPESGDAATASCPRSPSFFTTFDPMSPLPPITTIFMLCLPFLTVPLDRRIRSRRSSVPRMAHAPAKPLASSRDGAHHQRREGQPLRQLVKLAAELALGFEPVLLGRAEGAAPLLPE